MNNKPLVNLQFADHPQINYIITDQTAQNAISGISSVVSGKANLDSPIFSGTPSTPTPTTVADKNQIINIEYLQNTLGNVPVVDEITEEGTTWNIPGTSQNQYSKMRSGALTTNTLCRLNISTSFLTPGNFLTLKVDNTAGGSLLFGNKELITTSDTYKYLVNFVNFNR